MLNREKASAAVLTQGNIIPGKRALEGTKRQTLQRSRVGRLCRKGLDKHCRLCRLFCLCPTAELCRCGTLIQPYTPHPSKVSLSLLNTHTHTHTCTRTLHTSDTYVFFQEGLLTGFSSRTFAPWVSVQHSSQSDSTGQVRRGLPALHHRPFPPHCPIRRAEAQTSK